MIRPGLFLLFFLPLAQPVEAKQDTTRQTSWWLAYKMGASYSNVSEFQRWNFSEGLSGISASTRNTVIGFDILHNRNRMVFGLNADFELRSIGRTEPYFFSFAFRSGYTLIDQEKFKLKSLAGIGVGYALVRFENGTPSSLQAISVYYSDPFARASVMIGRLEIMTTYQFYSDGLMNNKLKIRPVLFFNVGVQPVLIHGDWNYGDTEMDSADGTRFVGQKINMPKFYKANWFASVGVALTLVSKG